MGEASVLLLWYSILIYVIPFQWWEFKIGKKMQPIKKASLDDYQKIEIINIRKAAFHANKLLLGIGKCFAMSLTLKRMLKCRGINPSLLIGFQKYKENHFIAHAWLQYDDTLLYGGNNLNEFYKECIIYT